MRGRAAGRLKVVIVGAGIGGLSAHLAFARAGFEVAHHERRSELGPAGAGIVIWPDGVKVLRTLGLGERLAAIGNRPDVLEVRGPDGRPLSELPLGEIWDRSEAPGYLVSRTELQDIILDAVGPGRVRMGTRCTGLEQSDTEVMVRFDGGLEARGDLAVGIVALSRRGVERLHARDESVYGETYRAIHASSAHRTAMTIEGWLARGPNG